MLDYVVKQTNIYIESMTKDERKKYGQFFTSRETASFMASMFEIPTHNSVLNILDAGAGTGILSCALIERLQGHVHIEKINLVCYENDPKVIEVLKRNLEYIKNTSHVVVEYTINTSNYIINQANDYNGMLDASTDFVKYDLVIGNPPYVKLSKDAPEATAMPNICYGAPNLYFLFAAMGLFNLKNNGELVYIIPRSWTSGAYFKKFREYFFSTGKLEHVHLFVSRKDVFDTEKVLQETIIIKMRKSNHATLNVRVTSSISNKDFGDISELMVPYNDIVSGDEYYVYLPTNRDEINVLEKINRFNNTLISIGLKMKTGLVVDFRNRELLRSEYVENAVPLFYAQHIEHGKITFPIGKENEYIVTDQKGLKQVNKNYLFVKRFTSKEESRRLQCGIYLASEYPDYNMISTQNKLNFIDVLDGEMTKSVAYGLYVIFNSTLYDMYYRILNGSTQVNSTEINAMPVPNKDIIEQMGQELQRSNLLTVEVCDRILDDYLKE